MERKRRSSEQIRKEILRYLEKQTFGRTTGQVANVLGINWNSANKYLTQLKNENLLYYERVGKQNQWCLMRFYESWKEKLEKIKS